MSGSLEQALETATKPKGPSLPQSAYENRCHQSDVDEFLRENNQVQSKRTKDQWRGIAWIAAGRLLRHIRTCSKKELTSTNMRNLMTSAAIAYDKAFPKEDQLSSAPALLTMNNLFVGSEVGKKVLSSLTQAIPAAQKEVQSYVVPSKE